jgi:hypothetical protein
VEERSVVREGAVGRAREAEGTTDERPGRRRPGKARGPAGAYNAPPRVEAA